MAIDNTDIKRLESQYGFNFKDIKQIKEGIEQYIEKNTEQMKELSQNIPTKQDNLKFAKVVDKIIEQNKEYFQITEKLITKLEDDSVLKRIESSFQKQEVAFNKIKDGLQKIFNQNITNIEKRISRSEQELTDVSLKTIDELKKTKKDDDNSVNESLNIFKTEIYTDLKKYSVDLSKIVDRIVDDSKKYKGQTDQFLLDIVDETDSKFKKFKKLTDEYETEFLRLDQRISDIETKFDSYIKEYNKQLEQDVKQESDNIKIDLS